MTTMIKRIVCGTILATLLLTAGSVRAIMFTGSSGSLSASADFQLAAGNLVITLRNTATADVLVPGQVLTALFFDTIPTATLTPVSALLGAGSTVWFGPINGGNVGGEWAYASGLIGAPGGARQGTSSTGLGLFGAGNFGGPNLQGPVSVDGLQYGITSAGDNPTTGNAAVTGGFALIHDSVVFTLTAVPADFSISNVRFLYGTSLSETIIPSDTPVPDGGSTIALLGFAMLGGGYLRRKLA